jgi:hypothetical protein
MSSDPLRKRSLQLMSTPLDWPLYPFLPLIRRTTCGVLECGVMIDLFHQQGLPGFSSTVFRTPLLAIPDQEEVLLALPKEMFDTLEEVCDAGWCVD